MKRGFTLIELLAVIALLGIIILVAVPSLIKSNEASKNNQKEELEKDFELACESYKAAHKDISSVVNVNSLIKEGYLDSKFVENCNAVGCNANNCS